MDISNAQDAILLLKSLPASPRLVVHHVLVLQAAEELIKGLQSKFRLDFDGNLVAIGAALHDCGKALHPEEIIQPGSHHERAGEQLLLAQGISPEMPRFSRTHATWDDPDTVLEDWLVALADKLWKGKREKTLEAKVIHSIAQRIHLPEWEVFIKADALFEAIAAKGPARLQRSISSTD